MKGYDAATHINLRITKLMKLGEISMKRMKKYLSVLLALMMVVCAIPMSTYAAEAEATVTSGTCGENVTWNYDDKTYTLTISGEGKMQDYDYNNRPWETIEDNIKHVIIKNGITAIGACAFEDCENIITASIPDGVTSIGDGAFCYCISLTDIVIPNNVASIGIQAFQECTNLTNITIPDSVMELGDWAFCYCTELESITMGNGIIKIGEMAFYECKSLINVTIPDSVTSIGNRAFDSCTSLVNASIGSGVTEVADYMFSGCKNLESVAFPHKLTAIGIGAFLQCSNLIDITIPNGTKTICTLSFAYCTNLTDITLPDSIKSIESSAFEKCKSLTSVYYAGTEEQWNDIVIDNTYSLNDPLLNANIYFNHIIEDTLILSIYEPSTTTIRYNDGIILHANLEGDIPDGCTLVWGANNSNFSTSQSANGDSMQIISKSKGYTTFTLKLVDAEGYTLAEDSIEMYSKSGFFDKIGGFFRGLFGLTKIYEN